MREQFPEHDRKSTLCSNIFSERKIKVMCICHPWYSERKEQTRDMIYLAPARISTAILCDRKNLKQGK